MTYITVVRSDLYRRNAATANKNPRQHWVLTGGKSVVYRFDEITAGWGSLATSNLPNNRTQSQIALGDKIKMLSHLVFQQVDRHNASPSGRVAARLCRLQDVSARGGIVEHKEWQVN